MNELKVHYLNLLERLDECVKNQTLTTYDKRSIVSMMKKVMDHLTEKFSNVKEGLGEIMFGKILNYEAHDILLQGKSEKLLELIQKKIAKGRSVEEIAVALEEDVETIQKIIDEHFI